MENTLPLNQSILLRLYPSYKWFDDAFFTPQQPMCRRDAMDRLIEAKIICPSAFWYLGEKDKEFVFQIKQPQTNVKQSPHISIRVD